MRPAGPTHGQLSADVGGDARPASDQPAVPGHDSATQIVPARSVTRTRTGGIWIGVIVAALVFIVLLIFIVQNTASVTIHFFGFAGALPIAVALLLAAVCGVLLVAIPGTVRILQLRKAVRKPTPR
jgi:uncharacterized integral membrane protein